MYLYWGKNMKQCSFSREDTIKELSKGLHKFSLNGVEYNATLDLSYIPALPNNKAEIRKNKTNKNQITFFDCNENIWVSFDINGD